mgnify:CR=1 FL=1
MPTKMEKDRKVNFINNFWTKIQDSAKMSVVLSSQPTNKYSKTTIIKIILREWELAFLPDLLDIVLAEILFWIRLG